MASSIAIIFLALLFTYSKSAEVLDETESARGQAILDEMLAHYDKRVPPTGLGENKSQVFVKVSMYVLGVEKVDDDAETFRAQFYFRQKWNDDRLRYGNRKTNLKMIYVKEDTIWWPDLFFNQESKGNKHDVIVPNIFTRVFPNGTVLRSVRLSITFRCKMDLTNFPFDTQKCVISAESYGYGVSMVEIGWDDVFMPLKYSKEISLKQYSLDNVEPSIGTTKPSDITYRQLNVIFTFSRKTAFYTIRLFLPFLILTALSWLTFWISPQHTPLRLTLLLTVLYLMVQIGSDVNLHYITATPYLKGSDIWIGTSVALVFASLLEFLLVSLLSRKEGGGWVRQVNVEAAPDDVEAKKVETERASMASSAKFVAKSMDGSLPERIDFLSRIMFPVTFIFFNVLYWSIYSSM